MKNVYFGTSDFAATVLEVLLASEHAPSLVVTRPARPKGRGKKLIDPPVAQLAEQRGVACFQPDDLATPEATERVLAEQPAALTVCAYGAIVKEPLLSARPSFNVHPSLLPRWRGAAPLERAIEAGDAATGVSIMRLVEELDAGPVCAREVVAIAPEDDYGSLAAKLAQLGGKLLVEALSSAERDELVWQEQLEGAPPGAVTYAEKIERADRRLDPVNTPAEQLARRVRALHPHVGAQLITQGGQPLRVLEARVVGQQLGPGLVRAEEGRLLVGTPDLTLELLRVQAAGGKAMDVESYLRGNDAPVLA